MRISDWSSDVCSSDLSQSLGDDLRGVQGAPVGAGDDAADPASGEAPGHLVRLALALLGELRLDDAGVDAGAGEVRVEVRLPVADTDRRSVRGPSSRLAARLSYCESRRSPASVDRKRVVSGKSVSDSG